MKNTLSKFFPLKNDEFRIFLFHGVIKKNKSIIRNYNNKHIIQKNFIDTLKFLKRSGNALDINELYFNIKNKIKLPKNSYLITFDDGFENNYSVAAPILDDLKIPTCFYFSTDFIENNTISWIDKIEYMIEKTKEKSLLLQWANNKNLINNKKNKIIFLKKIRKFVKKNFSIDINKLLDHLSEATKIKIPNSLNTQIDKKINWKQVEKLETNKLFTIGGHSHEHFSFGSMSKKEINYQINKSMILFKKRINLNLKHYSYPEGQKKDYTNYVINKLKSKKIICCPSAISGKNNIRTDFFNLKRDML